MANKTIYTMTAYIKDKKGNVLSVGKNSYIKTHPVMFKLGKQVGYKLGERINLHAEIDAINKCKNLSKAYSIEIFNYSESKDKYLPSKPCAICTLAISKTPIKFIKYFEDDEQIVSVLSIK
jgi:deoxycytidylate deaminase